MKETKGITLIALLVTIIVMLLLVGVTVQTVINSNLLNTTREAGKKYKEAYENDKDFGDENIIINDKEYEGVDGYTQTLNIPKSI